MNHIPATVKYITAGGDLSYAEFASIPEAWTFYRQAQAAGVQVGYPGIEKVVR